MSQLMEPIFNYKPMTADQVQSYLHRYQNKEKKAESFFNFACLFAVLTLLAVLSTTVGVPEMVACIVAGVLGVSVLVFAGLCWARRDDLRWMESPFNFEPLHGSDLKRLADFAEANSKILEIWKGWAASNVQVTRRDFEELERYWRKREMWLERFCLETRVKTLLNQETDDSTRC